jgi:hypothetical protein
LYEVVFIDERRARRDSTSVLTPTRKPVQTFNTNSKSFTFKNQATHRAAFCAKKPAVNHPPQTTSEHDESMALNCLKNAKKQ